MSDLRIFMYSFQPESHSLEITGRQSKPPNPFLLFFDNWRRSESAPKRMTEASKEASVLWGNLPNDEKDRWRKNYELIRDRKVIHNMYDEIDRNIASNTESLS